MSALPDNPRAQGAGRAYELFRASISAAEWAAAVDTAQEAIDASEMLDLLCDCTDVIDAALAQGKPVAIGVIWVAVRRAAAARRAHRELYGTRPDALPTDKEAAHLAALRAGVRLPQREVPHG